MELGPADVSSYIMHFLLDVYEMLIYNVQYISAAVCRGYKEQCLCMH